MDYFFKEVIPQMLNYFNNDKDLINYLVLDVLKKDSQYKELLKNEVVTENKENSTNKIITNNTFTK